MVLDDLLSPLLIMSFLPIYKHVSPNLNYVNKLLNFNKFLSISV